MAMMLFRYLTAATPGHVRRPPEAPSAVGVLTYEAKRGRRMDLLRQTLTTVRAAFPSSCVMLVDNGTIGSTIGDLGVEALEAHGVDGTTTCTHSGGPGLGLRRVAHSLRDAAVRATFWVCSDDDMVWKPGAEEKLARFWAEAPEDIAIVSGLLEPEYEWNAPLETVEAGGVRVLVRESAPGCAWSFRPSMWQRIQPMPEDWSFDFEVCQRLRFEGLRVAQLDLADHAGWGRSFHGNESAREGKPLDRERWGV